MFSYPFFYEQIITQRDDILVIPLHIELKNYFTSSLKLLPAENAGTVFAAIFNSLPV